LRLVARLLGRNMLVDNLKQMQTQSIDVGTDVAIEATDIVLMRAGPLDVPVALRTGKGTLGNMRQNLGWAIGYNVTPLPIAAKE